MKCLKCGAENPDNSKFCRGCGAVMEKESEQQGGMVFNQTQDNENQGAQASAQNVSGNKFSGIGTRNIALCVLFSIITCGIYGLYWMYKINQEVNTISNHKEDTSGGLVVLFSLITCGIYNIYWGYKIGSKLKEYYLNNDSMLGSELPVLFLILFALNYAACGALPMIAYSLMQDKINKIVTA